MHEQQFKKVPGKTPILLSCFEEQRATRWPTPPEIYERGYDIICQARQDLGLRFLNIFSEFTWIEHMRSKGG